ncbi:General stress protein 69 [Thalassoglobus neptunius]|uniref:General stress protein 69 n=1 Tax=Thalassoglobus neptunius TaxID=1938619 RepID=A0A5C5X5Y1_9PLAN|nr:aldo/keto reductase [Thalassoglobus neptunius]TWT58426.1 General stress protein 69 [Thalassoglobus neptunius]
MSVLRKIGTTDIEVTPVAMGCWPITGITSVDVTREASLQTLQAAFDSGINFFDTAYSYGYEGESERMIAEVLGSHRDEIVIASKCGLSWNSAREKIRDARPEVIRKHCEESLKRLNTDRIDLYYLHAPDPQTPVEDSAAVLRELLDSGKIRAVGVSNFHTVESYETFQQVCPIAAAQPHYNMLQREIEDAILPWCLTNQVSVIPYWPLMKGFLAGKLSRDHEWDPKDGRQKYGVFQGREWDKTHDFLDELRPLAESAGITMAQLAIAWTIQRPGITAALCGAKRPEQIRDTAQAMKIQLSESTIQAIDEAIVRRGPVISHPAVT